MKILVAFYSRTGNTKKVALEISKALKADVEEIADTKDRRGIIGYLVSGKDATFKRHTIIKDLKKNSSEYDLVIVGTPVWAWSLTPPVRAYLHKTKKSLKKVAFFCTEGGSGGKSAFEDMSRVTGKKPLTTLEIKESEIKKGLHHKKIREFIMEVKK